jgi:hypothetical protein|tara:strand:+ start:273 stop:995 length:723 start_codon:yes stop_codon:yes gene_type:complete
MKLKYILFPLLLVFYFIFYQLNILDVSSDVFYDNSNKLWAHRILDPQKVNDLKEEFIGYEIDVFFNNDKNIFDVRHHGVTNDIDLVTFLNEIENLHLIKFWIDFKNLNSSNVESAIFTLDKIALEFDVKSNIIIESKNINLLSAFKLKGFFISYWLPSFHVFKSVFNILNIRDDLRKYKPNAISMPYSSVLFYSKKFPNYPLHCWTNEMTSDLDKIKIKKLSKKNNVKIILTDFKNNFLK